MRGDDHPIREIVTDSVVPAVRNVADLGAGRRREEGILPQIDNVPNSADRVLTRVARTRDIDHLLLVHVSAALPGQVGDQAVEAVRRKSFLDSQQLDLSTQKRPLVASLSGQPRVFSPQPLDQLRQVRVSCLQARH